MPKINVHKLAKACNINLNDPRIAPLSTADLARLSRRAVEGDTAARDRVINSMFKLCLREAGQAMKHDQSNLLDLLQEGMSGVCRALQTFDPDRGVKFSTHASWWIKARILKSVIDNHSMIKIGTSDAQRTLFFRLNKTRAKLLRAGVTPDADAIAELCEVAPEQVAEMEHRLNRPIMSGDQRLAGEDGDGCTLFDTLADDADTGAYVSDKRMLDWLHTLGAEFYATLTKPTDRMVWNHRILPTMGDPMSLPDLGDLIGTSRQYIEQIEKRVTARFLRYAARHAR